MTDEIRHAATSNNLKINYKRQRVCEDSGDRINKHDSMFSDNITRKEKNVII
jgi:hypothetical protein